MPNLLTEIILVRHGETAWNTEDRIQGHTDIPLNELGSAQAAAVGKRLRGEDFAAIYSSDLDRAHRTARPVVDGSNRSLALDTRLRERHLGVLQGLTGEEAQKDQPQAWKAFKSRQPEEALEGGESLGEFSRRVVGFLEEMLHRHAGGRILLVTHGGALDAAYRHATGMRLDAPRDFPIYNASINVLQYRDGRWRVESWGDVSHLPRELAMDET